MKWTFQKLILVFFTLSGLLIVMSGCGPSTNVNDNCAGNVGVVGDQMALAVTRIASYSYKLTLCNQPNIVGMVSVFGSNSLQAFDTRTATPRKANIATLTQPGASVQVDFYPTDTYFAIYLDRDVGGGQYYPDMTTVLLAPHTIPQ